jgi:transposase
VDEEILTDELWARVEPLLPLHPRRFRHPGRRRADDRAALEGILWVLRNGVGWNRVPTRLFGVSGATCWRRLDEWWAAGSGTRSANSCSVSCAPSGSWTWTPRWWTPPSCAPSKGDQIGPSAVDRGRNGSKHHLITDATGIPLAVILTGGNRNDVTQLLPLLEAIPKIRGARGRPRQRPRRVYADRGYDHDNHRAKVRDLGATPIIARRNTEHGSGLGVHRWVVERSFAWLHAFKRLRTRYEPRAAIHEALISVACSMIYLRQLILN